MRENETSIAVTSFIAKKFPLFFFSIFFFFLNFSIDDGPKQKTINVRRVSSLFTTVIVFFVLFRFDLQPQTLVTDNRSLKIITTRKRLDLVVDDFLFFCFSSPNRMNYNQRLVVIPFLFFRTEKIWETKVSALVSFDSIWNLILSQENRVAP